MKLHYLSEESVPWLRKWWQALDEGKMPEKGTRQRFLGLGRGDRARLRRANSVEELETERAAGLLVAYLAHGEWKSIFVKNRFAADPSALLMIAGVLAMVETDSADGESLARKVGVEGKEKARMNEIRFRRLLQAKSLEDFFRQVRRAVQLANGAVDVAVLADDLLAWAYEQELAAGAQRPARSLCFRWAQDYYQPLKEKDAAQAAKEQVPEGEMV